MKFSRAAFQQALTDLVLQPFDRSAQGGLRQKDSFRGASDIACFSHRHEVTQVLEFQARQHTQKAVSGQ